MSRFIQIMVFVLCSSICWAQSDCIDYTNLEAAECTYGSFEDPYETLGVGLDRHTVFKYATDFDECVPTLCVLPPNGLPSVRLGNKGSDRRAESITYKYTVPRENPILLLHYAAVLQNPPHGSEDQPKFSIHIYDKFHRYIGGKCSHYDFVANASLEYIGWNQMQYGDDILLWRDWTYVAVNLKDYISEPVYIRLVTYDCAQGAHFGYAYFTLQCSPEKIDVNTCGETSVLTAPHGFVYHWYTDDADLGTAQSITVPADGTRYYCDLSSTENFSCTFTLDTVPVPIHIIADFYNQVRYGVCADTVSFVDNSFVSSDGVNPVVPYLNTEETWWDFGNGRTSADTDPSQVVYIEPGQYTIKMVSMYKNCLSDTVVKRITFPERENRRVLYDTICEGSAYQLGDTTLMSAGVYVRTISDATCGKEVLVELHLQTIAGYENSFSATFCRNEPYFWRGYRYTKPGTYYDSLVNSHGCDSVFILHLDTVSYYEFTIHDTICEGENYVLNGVPYHATDIYTQSLRSIDGCDSIVHLDLIVHEKHDPAFKNGNGGWVSPGQWIDPYIETNEDTSSITPPSTPVDTIWKPIGQWEDPYLDFIIYDTVCDQYEVNGNVYYESALFREHHTTVFGCDSVVYHHVTIQPCACDTAYSHTYANIKEKDLPYTWNNQTLPTMPHNARQDTTLIYPTIKADASCDSIAMLHLHVLFPCELPTETKPVRWGR